ncbi:hypothetical protein RHGRI_014560 [Rhododendron griersonianum]|uniref:Uncharacterized protein n=1 Tax=Rhododendron griersonianum TaxID=479676 RepID=A0AAV6KA84_9ERIC|nr:hypothetical protein RHGRI_014560 [Rhododendron griersonianum]
MRFNLGSNTLSVMVSLHIFGLTTSIIWVLFAKELVILGTSMWVGRYLPRFPQSFIMVLGSGLDQGVLLPGRLYQILIPL